MKARQDGGLWAAVMLSRRQGGRGVFSHWPIRKKLKLGLGLLALSVTALFACSIHGLYAYRGLAKSLSARSTELPLAKELGDRVNELRVILAAAKERVQNQQDAVKPDLDKLNTAGDAQEDMQFTLLREIYHYEFEWFLQALRNYRCRLDANQLDANQASVGTRFADDFQEQQTLGEIDKLISGMDEGLVRDAFTWQVAGEGRLDTLREEIEKLYDLATELPSHLHDRFIKLAGDVRAWYRFAIPFAWVTALLSGGLLVTSLLFFRKWISRPLKTLVEGCKIASDGKFDHRICLETHDEMQELAEAMNKMTKRFKATRDDLDRQVCEQTRQVVRSEQLASVGLLAAGVAHEINNPLASIAMGSESLVRRLEESESSEQHPLSAEKELFRKYLQMIEAEAFRCKEITDKLLDFSRLGDSEKHNVELREIVTGVIEMVRLGKYKGKKIVLREGGPVVAQVNFQEFKQVMLNLITNALNSIETGGTVTVDMATRGGRAEIAVEDDGCGMTDDVIQHLFEPFFTRRHTGQGTGLGLSITFRIIEEHQGQINATSEGVGKGSKFTVSLPLQQMVTNEPTPAVAA